MPLGSTPVSGDCYAMPMSFVTLPHLSGRVVACAMGLLCDYYAMTMSFGPTPAPGRVGDCYEVPHLPQAVSLPVLLLDEVLKAITRLRIRNGQHLPNMGYLPNKATGAAAVHASPRKVRLPY